MSRALRTTLLTVSLFGFLAQVASAYVSPGLPAGFVNDYADIIASTDQALLEQKLSAFEKDTNHEISIATVKNLGGDTIENFAVELFREWGIGKKKADNGVLLLVALEDRSVRIEVGYGLEGVLTDSLASGIVQKIIIPAFKSGDFSGGIGSAVDAIMAAAKGEVVDLPAGGEGADLSGLAIFIAIFIFVAGFESIFLRMFLIFLGKSPSWWAGGVAGGLFGGFVGIFLAAIVSPVIVVGIAAMLGLAFDFWASRSYAKAKLKGALPWWWVLPKDIDKWRRGSGGGWGSSGGSSSSGFGGFGGGGSGGGGASGRW